MTTAKAETIVRACGHAALFVPKGDRFDDARREKLRGKRCLPCGEAKSRADNAAAAGGVGRRVRKGQEVKALPPGAVTTLTLREDGWHGSMVADGVEVTTVSAGAMGILSKLARKWLAARGRALTGRVQE